MAKTLLAQLRETLRIKHYSYRTEESYVNWVRRFILFHNKRHPAEMGAPETQAFLAHLAQEKNVSASPQNQALSALLFLYRAVLQKEIAPVLLSSAKRPEHLPTVLSREAVRLLLNQISGVHKRMAQFLYDSGLRLMECLHLRIQDMGFTDKTLTVRDGNTSPAGCAVTPPASRILYLRFIRVVHQRLVDSATGARHDTGGWLALTRRGLSPRNIRQASLGARTAKLSRSLRQDFFHQFDRQHTGQSPEVASIISPNEGTFSITMLNVCHERSP